MLGSEACRYITSTSQLIVLLCCCSTVCHGPLAVVVLTDSSVAVPAQPISWPVCRSVVCRVNRGRRTAVVAQAAAGKYDYDLVIIGCGVGGHGAALHAVEQVSSPQNCP